MKVLRSPAGSVKAAIERVFSEGVRPGLHFGRAVTSGKGVQTGGHPADTPALAFVVSGEISVAGELDPLAAGDAVIWSVGDWYEWTSDLSEVREASGAELMTFPELFEHEAE